MPSRVEGLSLSRRTLFEAAAAGAIAGAAPLAGARAAEPMPAVPLSLRINGQSHALDLDPRTTLLDAPDALRPGPVAATVLPRRAALTESGVCVSN